MPRLGYPHAYARLFDELRRSGVLDRRPPAPRVLDCGLGPGTLSAAFARAVPGVTIHLAFSVLHLGIAIWVNSPWLIATLMVTVAVMAIVVIPREERYLEGRLGTEYLTYKAAARRRL